MFIVNSVKFAAYERVVRESLLRLKFRMGSMSFIARDSGARKQPGGYHMESPGAKAVVTLPPSNTQKRPEPISQSFCYALP